MQLSDITIRTTLIPGDIGYLIFLHADLYKKEYGYEVDFECYVAEGVTEFARQYDPKRNRIWVCEHNGKRVGFLVLKDRGEAAQLRHFLLMPEYRGIGLGSKLMELFVAFLKECGYASCYLWTTKELHQAAALYTKFGFKLAEEKKSRVAGIEVVEQKYELTFSSEGFTPAYLR